MPNQWFKFYGGEYLIDPKILALTATQRSCWVTLLCYASQSDGIINYLSETQLMTQSGIEFTDSEWDETKGVLNRFKELKMIQIDNDVITVLNWKKRQEVHSESYERLKKWREKKRNETLQNVSNETVRIEENREDKKRIDNKYTPQDLESAQLLHSLILERNPAWYVKPDWDTWADDIRKIRELDKRTHGQIAIVIRWAQQDSFWSGNILSPAKLRKQFNTLVVQMGNKVKGSRPKMEL